MEGAPGTASDKLASSAAQRQSKVGEFLPTVQLPSRPTSKPSMTTTDPSSLPDLDTVQEGSKTQPGDTTVPTADTGAVVPQPSSAAEPSPAPDAAPPAISVPQNAPDEPQAAAPVKPDTSTAADPCRPAGDKAAASQPADKPSKNKALTQAKLSFAPRASTSAAPPPAAPPPPPGPTPEDTPAHKEQQQHTPTPTPTLPSLTQPAPDVQMQPADNTQVPVQGDQVLVSQTEHNAPAATGPAPTVSAPHPSTCHTLSAGALPGLPAAPTTTTTTTTTSFALPCSAGATSSEPSKAGISSSGKATTKRTAPSPGPAAATAADAPAPAKKKRGRPPKSAQQQHVPAPSPAAATPVWQPDADAAGEAQGPGPSQGQAISFVGIDLQAFTRITAPRAPATSASAAAAPTALDSGPLAPNAATPVQAASPTTAQPGPAAHQGVQDTKLQPLVPEQPAVVQVLEQPAGGQVLEQPAGVQVHVAAGMDVQDVDVVHSVSVAPSPPPAIILVQPDSQVEGATGGAEQASSAVPPPASVEPQAVPAAAPPPASLPVHTFFTKRTPGAVKPAQPAAPAPATQPAAPAAAAAPAAGPQAQEVKRKRGRPKKSAAAAPAPAPAPAAPAGHEAGSASSKPEGPQGAVDVPAAVSQGPPGGVGGGGAAADLTQPPAKRLRGQSQVAGDAAGTCTPDAGGGQEQHNVESGLEDAAGAVHSMCEDATHLAAAGAARVEGVSGTVIARADGVVSGGDAAGAGQVGVITLDDPPSAHAAPDTRRRRTRVSQPPAPPAPPAPVSKPAKAPPLRDTAKAKAAKGKGATAGTGKTRAGGPEAAPPAQPLVIDMVEADAGPPAGSVGCGVAMEVVDLTRTGPRGVPGDGMPGVQPASGANTPTPAGLGGGGGGVESGKKGVLCEMFLPVAERRRLKQQAAEAKRQQELQQQQQAAAPPAHPAPVQDGSTPQAKGPDPTVLAPLSTSNPFFQTRKRAFRAADDPGGRPAPVRSAADRVLAPALAPVHITQLLPAASSDVDSTEMQVDPGQAAQTHPHTREAPPAISLSDLLLTPTSYATQTSPPGSSLTTQPIHPSSSTQQDTAGAGPALALRLIHPPAAARPALAAANRQATAGGGEGGAHLLLQLAHHLAGRPLASADPQTSMDSDDPQVRTHLTDLEAALSDICTAQDAALAAAAPASNTAARQQQQLAQGDVSSIVHLVEEGREVEVVMLDTPVPDKHELRQQGQAGVSRTAGDEAAARNLMWTTRFQPTNATQLCGNAGPVRELKTWLEGWRDAINAQSNNIAAADPGACIRKKKSWQMSDDDTVWHDESSLGSWMAGSPDAGCASSLPSCANNAVVLSGPTGCGKTAALAAAAKEVGFSVMEINAGIDRSGAALLRMVGEATQSRQLHQGRGRPAGGVLFKEQAGSVLANQGAGQGKAGHKQGGKRQAKERGSSGGSTPTKPKRGAAKRAAADDDGELSSDVPQFSSDDDSDTPVKRRGKAGGRGKRGRGAAGPGGTGAASRRRQQQQQQVLGVVTEGEELVGLAAGAVGLKGLSLILFEDADLLLEEDKGFVSALAALITDTKRPIVLCVNSALPPPGLAHLRLNLIRFSPPSDAELLRSACLMCCAAGLQHAVSLQQVMQVVDDSQGSLQDIRRCVLQLQLQLAGPASTLRQPALAELDPPAAGQAAPTSRADEAVCTEDVFPLLAAIEQHTLSLAITTSSIPPAGQHPAPGTGTGTHAASDPDLPTCWQPRLPPCPWQLVSDRGLSISLPGTQPAAGDGDGVVLSGQDVEMMDRAVAAAGLAPEVQPDAALGPRAGVCQELITRVVADDDDAPASAEQLPPGCVAAGAAQGPAAAVARQEQLEAYEAACDAARAQHVCQVWELYQSDQRLLGFRPGSTSGRGRGGRAGAAGSRRALLGLQPSAAPLTVADMALLSHGLMDDEVDDSPVLRQRPVRRVVCDESSDEEGAGQQVAGGAGGPMEVICLDTQPASTPDTSQDKQEAEGEGGQSGGQVSESDAAHHMCVDGACEAEAASEQHFEAGAGEEGVQQEMEQGDAGVLAGGSQAVSGQGGSVLALAPRSSAPGGLDDELSGEAALLGQHVQQRSADVDVEMQETDVAGRAKTPVADQEQAGADPGAMLEDQDEPGQQQQADKQQCTPHLAAVQPRPTPPMPPLQLPPPPPAPAYTFTFLKRAAAEDAALLAADQLSQQQQVLRSFLASQSDCCQLSALAYTCDLVSVCDVLSGPRDPVPPVSGPCAPAHQQLYSASRPLLPGMNLAITCSEAVRQFPRGLLVGAPSCPGRTGLTAGAAAQGTGPLRLGGCFQPCDGAAPAAAMQDLLQYEGEGMFCPPPVLPTPTQPSVPQLAAREVCTQLLRSGSVAALLQPHQQSGVMRLERSDAEPVAVPAAMTSWGPTAQRLVTCNDSTLYSCLIACVQGHPSAAVDRVAALGRICRFESDRIRVAEQTLTGRARRASRAQHVLQTTCPDLPDTLWPALQQLATFGAPRD